MDVLDRADLPFPHSLPEFQRLFPDDAACAAYLEKAAGETALPARTAARRESRSTLKPPWRPALPQVPPEHRADGGNSDGA